MVTPFAQYSISVIIDVLIFLDIFGQGMQRKVGSGITDLDEERLLRRSESRDLLDGVVSKLVGHVEVVRKLRHFLAVAGTILPLW